MQNGDMLIFFLRSFRKKRFRKMQFLKDGVQTVVCLLYLGKQWLCPDMLIEKMFTAMLSYNQNKLLP